jgi:dihydropteroate synthase
MALLGGADILRVHDVKEAMESIKIYEALKSIVK